VPALVFGAPDLLSGTHIGSVGNVTGRELDGETFRRPRVLLHSREGCLEERETAPSSSKKVP